MPGRRILLAMVLSLAGGCTPAPVAPLPDLGGRVLRVAVLADYPPFSRVDPASGAPVGWDVDVFQALGERLNFVPEFVLTTPGEIVAGTASGQWDLAGGGISISTERLATVDFAIAQRQMDQRLVVRAGDVPAATLVAFKRNAALRVGALAGSVNERTAAAFLGADRVRMYPDLATLVAALVGREVEGIVLDDAPYRTLAAEKPDALTRLPGTLGSTAIGFVLAKGSELTAPINVGYAALVVDGTMGTLDARWGLE